MKHFLLLIITISVLLISACKSDNGVNPILPPGEWKHKFNVPVELTTTHDMNIFAACTCTSFKH